MELEQEKLYANKLLDSLKRDVFSVTTDCALAARLGVSRARVSQWRSSGMGKMWKRTLAAEYPTLVQNLGVDRSGGIS